MKTLFMATALAATAISTIAVGAAPAAAQSRTSIASANIAEAIQRSRAATTAQTQLQTTYAAQIQALNTRSAALDAELAGLANAYNTAARAPGATEATVRPAAEALQRRRQTAQQEVQVLNQPLALAEAYVSEQIQPHLDPAIRAAMTARRVDLLVQPGAVIANEPYVDITAAITAELDRRVPQVNIVPPAGWQPRQQGQPGQPAQPAAQPQQPPATQPDGR